MLPLHTVVCLWEHDGGGSLMPFNVCRAAGKLAMLQEI